MDNRLDIVNNPQYRILFSEIKDRYDEEVFLRSAYYDNPDLMMHVLMTRCKRSRKQTKQLHKRIDIIAGNWPELIIKYLPDLVEWTPDHGRLLPWDFVMALSMRHKALTKHLIPLVLAQIRADIKHLEGSPQAQPLSNLMLYWPSERPLRRVANSDAYIQRLRGKRMRQDRLDALIDSAECKREIKYMFEAIRKSLGYDKGSFRKHVRIPLRRMLKQQAEASVGEYNPLHESKMLYELIGSDPIPYDLLEERLDALKQAQSHVFADVDICWDYTRRDGKAINRTPTDLALIVVVRYLQKKCYAPTQMTPLTYDIRQDLALLYNKTDPCSLRRYFERVITSGCPMPQYLFVLTQKPVEDHQLSTIRFMCMDAGHRMPKLIYWDTTGQGRRACENFIEGVTRWSFNWMVHGLWPEVANQVHAGKRN